MSIEFRCMQKIWITQMYREFELDDIPLLKMVDYEEKRMLALNIKIHLYFWLVFRHDQILSFNDCVGKITICAIETLLSCSS